MSIELPIISIITVVYNAVNSIEKTILSIIDQHCSATEYIIIDGGSTDGTLDIIKRYKDKFSYYVSEKDNGIYHAMNKGIAKSKGLYVYFINAGDLSYLIPFNLIKNSNADLICFPVQLSNGKIFFPEINNSIKIKNTLPHQGCYYKKTNDLVYNTIYKVFSDFALNQTFYRLKKNIIVMDHPIVGYHDIEGISHNKKYGNEVLKIVYDQYGWINLLKSYFYFKWSGVKVLFQKYLNT